MPRHPRDRPVGVVPVLVPMVVLVPGVTVAVLMPMVLVPMVPVIAIRRALALLTPRRRRLRGRRIGPRRAS